jgi:hypothetical protein
MSYNYQSRGRQAAYDQMSNSQYEYNDYSPNGYSPNGYSPSYNNSYGSGNYKYSPTSMQQQQAQQYYSAQQAAQYQQKQYRIQNSNGMGMNPSATMLYNVNPDAAMAYRQRKMQQAAERKYQKLCRLTNRLRDQLRLQTIPVFKAAGSLVNYTVSVKDPLVPSVWGPIEKRDNPYAATNSSCSCNIL